MRYEDVLPITRQEAELAFSSNNETTICDALIRITYHDPDWKWVQLKCLYFGKHPISEIRRLAATCVGHLARIHGILDIDPVYSLLHELLTDPDVSGSAQDALDDMNTYLGCVPDNCAQRQ